MECIAQFIKIAVLYTSTEIICISEYTHSVDRFNDLKYTAVGCDGSAVMLRLCE